MFLAVLTVVLVVVVLVVAAITAFAVRRRLIQRPGGTFDCSFRSPASGSPAAPAGNPPAGAAARSGAADTAEGSDHGKGWVFGIARYSGDRIEWFRVFSYSPRPRRVLERAEIEVVGRRPPAGQEELALLSGAVVLDCRHAGDLIELAMSEDALTGFLAWLEAAPPGQRVNVA